MYREEIYTEAKNEKSYSIFMKNIKCIGDEDYLVRKVQVGETNL